MHYKIRKNMSQMNPSGFSSNFCKPTGQPIGPCTDHLVYHPSLSPAQLYKGTILFDPHKL
jgi:hypothetical protein